MLWRGEVGLSQKGENVVMVTKGFVNMVTVADLRVMVTHFYSIELW